MVPVIVLLTIAIFILVDVLTRLTMKRIEERKARRAREEALEIGLRLEFAEEARSLKRVEVDDPRARILAVDDEPVVLDSFRKILVLAGYSVDTVESGTEALKLVRDHDYDFVFTDLKMPDYDGLEVTKAVKHLRPDIDVVMITGYATIESAVAAMKYGAMDYVQKPFTEEELVEFTDRCLHRRQARLEGEVPPRFHLVSAVSGESEEPRVVNVAGGRFVTPQHTWAALEITGEVRIGVDDFCVKTLGEIDAVELPEEGRKVRRGEPLFSLRHGAESLSFTSPVSGRVTRSNSELVGHLEILRHKPWDLGWICRVDARDPGAELRAMRLGAESLDWYRDQVTAFNGQLAAIRAERPAAEPGADDESELAMRWRAFGRTFLTQREVVGA